MGGDIWKVLYRLPLLSSRERSGHWCLPSEPFRRSPGGQMAVGAQPVGKRPFRHTHPCSRMCCCSLSKPSSAPWSHPGGPFGIARALVSSLIIRENSTPKGDQLSVKPGCRICMCRNRYFFLRQPSLLSVLLCVPMWNPNPSLCVPSTIRAAENAPSLLPGDRHVLGVCSHSPRDGL